MTLAVAAQAVALIAAAVCAITDLRTRHIYDVVTLPALALGLALHLPLGWDGVKASLLGALVAGGPFAVAFVFGWMADGDLKLMAALGALLGWPLAVGLLLCVSVAGGVQGVAWLVAARARGKPPPTHLPYGLAIAVGAVVAILLSSEVPTS